MNADSGPEVAFKNRKVGLVLCGVGQLLLGACCVLMVGLLLVCVFVVNFLPQSARAEMNAPMMTPAFLFYGALGVLFIVLGIGSIMARRWARALALIISWIWLIGGVSALVILLHHAVLRHDFEGTARSGGDAGVLRAAGVCCLGRLPPAYGCMVVRAGRAGVHVCVVRRYLCPDWCA